MTRFDVLAGMMVYEACYVHNYVQLGFDPDHGLTINNKFELVGAEHIGHLVGKRLKSFSSISDRIVLEFEGQAQLIIDLRENAWRGPEALELHGPNNLIVVWTPEQYQ
jgi:hypothetical protein